MRMSLPTRHCSGSPQRGQYQHLNSDLIFFSYVRLDDLGIVLILLSGVPGFLPN